MLHKDSKVALPDKGIVLVTGLNGSGKSSIVESVAVGCWGKSLRGTCPWSSEDGEVDVDVSVSDDRLVINRVQKKGKSSLDWARFDEESASTYATMTKAQEALDQVIGSQWVWRRTHVLRAQDGACFTQSTDAERKRLLEGLIGLDKFDQALANCRVELKSKEFKKAEAEREVALSEVRRQAAERLVKDSSQALGDFTGDLDIEDIDRLKKLWERLTKQGNEGAMKISEVMAERRKLLEQTAVATERDRVMRARVALLKEKAKCPTCNQDLHETTRRALLEEDRVSAGNLKKVRSEIDAQMKVIDGKVFELEEERDETREVLRDVGCKMSGAKAKLRAKEEYEKTRAEAQVRSEKAELELEDAIVKETSCRDVYKQCCRDVGELSAVDQVLGLKGVRAHVLGSTLGAIEVMVNGWLQKIVGDNLSIRLTAYSEKKAGGVSDAIGLDIVGAGGGYGYYAASDGERRRIDVAMLFALAEIASASQGTTPGTLFVDECFDGLDSEGVPRVLEVISELARERAVVVITHNEALREKVSPVLHLHVNQGEVREVA